MSKNAFVSPILRKSLQSRSRFSKKILERVSRGPPETTRELVGLEDSTVPYDAGFGHLQRTPSIMIRAGSIVAQVRRMLKRPLIPPMLRKSRHSRARFSKKILGRVSSRPPENKTRGLVGLEDSTAPYDVWFGHLQQTPSIVIQASSIVAQVRPMLRNQSCASSEMSKRPLFPPILCQNFHSCARLSKKILRQVSPQPLQNKTRGLVGLEDSAAPYDAGFGHLQWTPSIMIQAGSIVAQVRRMSRGHSCASSEMSKKRLIPAMLRKISRVAQRFQNKTFGRDCSARSGGPTTDGVEVDRTLANSRELCCDGKTENDIGNPMKHGD